MSGPSAPTTPLSPPRDDNYSVHWNVRAWTEIAMPVVSSTDPLLDYQFNSIDAISPTNVWAVGEVGDNVADYFSSGGGGAPSGTLIEHYDGTSWSIVSVARLGRRTVRRQQRLSPQRVGRRHCRVKDPDRALGRLRLADGGQPRPRQRQRPVIGFGHSRRHDRLGRRVHWRRQRIIDEPPRPPGRLTTPSRAIPMTGKSNGRYGAHYSSR